MTVASAQKRQAILLVGGRPVGHADYETALRLRDLWNDQVTENEEQVMGDEVFWSEGEQELIDFLAGAISGCLTPQSAAKSIIAAIYAQAIEARRAETGTGSVHESAVGNADASDTGSDTAGRE